MKKLKSYKKTLIGLIIIFILTATYIFIWEINRDEWIGRKITFPKEMYLIDNFKLLNIDEFKNSENYKKNKIISIVDVSCTDCFINQFKKIDSIFSPILKKEENSIMVFILNIKQRDSVLFMSQIRPQMKTDGILIWTKEYNFEFINDILTHNLGRRTFMTDENNKIILVGSPVFYDKILTKYKIEIKANNN